MRWDFVIIGATGMQGRIASRDLLEKGYRVLLCGRDRSKVDFLLKKFSRSGFSFINLEDMPALKKILRASDSKITINCAEGDWNFQVLRACTAELMHCLDLGSDIPMTRRQLSMHSRLKKKGIIHITGCGSVPGIGNVMTRYAAESFDSISSIEVGFA